MKTRFDSRKYLILGIIILVGVILIGKLFYLQVLSDQYKVSALNNSQRHIIQYPPRGIIYDRNKKIMATNQVAYDLMVIPGQVESFDTLQFAHQLNISVDEFKKRLEKASNYSSFKASAFYKLLSSREYAGLQEYIYQYRGFYVQPRLLRQYTNKNAPHVLGDIGEVNQQTIEKQPYYQAG
ncbi:MAG TPA: hypothetical protein VJ946_09205, partial [Bacteroidales bacterium]|nr:hypothetical protein [Bacteroidales bacterium]